MSWWHDPPTYWHRDSEDCPCEDCENDRRQDAEESEETYGIIEPTIDNPNPQREDA